jgi:hypothetical protein
MSDEQVRGQIFVGSVVALVGAIAGAIATAIINLLFAGKLNFNYWWTWVLGGAVLALVLFWLFRRSQQPILKYGQRVAIRTYDNTYVTLDLNHFNQMVGGAKEIKAWQLFEIHLASNPYSETRKRSVRYGDKIALRAVNNDCFVGASLHSQAELTAWVTYVKEWETFILCFSPATAPGKHNLVSFGSSFALQADNGKYVQYAFAADKRLFAIADGIKEWETFEFVKPD